MQPETDVAVPGPLRRAVARLLVLGLAEQSRRDGGVRPAPGLAQFLHELDRPASGPAVGKIALSPYTTGWVSTREAAELTQLNERQVRRLAASGRLIARRAGRDWLINRQSAQDYAGDTRRRHRSAA